jgi:hypothetical protein
LRYCRKELDRFKSGIVDAHDPATCRSLRKLQEDVRRAEVDLGYAQRDLQAAALNFTFTVK